MREAKFIWNMCYNIWLTW